MKLDFSLRRGSSLEFDDARSSNEDAMHAYIVFGLVTNVTTYATLFRRRTTIGSMVQPAARASRSLVKRKTPPKHHGQGKEGARAHRGSQVKLRLDMEWVEIM